MKRPRDYVDELVAKEDVVRAARAELAATTEALHSVEGRAGRAERALAEALGSGAEACTQLTQQTLSLQSANSGATHATK